MAKLLASEVRKIPGIEITQPVDANAVFAIIPTHIIALLQEKYRFYIWDDKTKELRWMCSFDTTPEEVMDFVDNIKSFI